MTSNVSINGLSMFFTVKRFSLLWITLISSSFIFLACARTHRKQDAQIAFESEAMEPTPASSQVLVGALKNVRDGASDDQKLFQELNLQTSEAIFLFDPKPSGFGLVEIPPSLMRFLDPNYAEGLVTRTEALGAEGLERLDSLYKHRAPFASAVRQGQATENALRIHISDASKNTSIEAFEQTLKESDDKARLAEELLADLQKKDPRLPIQKDELEHLTIESFSSLYSKFNRRFAQLKAIDCDGCEEVSLLGSYRETEPKMLLLKTEFEKQTTRAIGKENFNKDATVTYRGVQLPPGSDLEATRAEVAKFENGQVQGKELPQAIEVAMNEY